MNRRCGHVLGNARGRPPPTCHGCAQEQGGAKTALLCLSGTIT